MRDEHRAEDVVQDAYVLALERPPREARSLGAWLGVVVGNLARNERRGAARLELREQARAREERLEPDELALETLEIQRALIDLVVTLPEDLRTVLFLRYYGDLRPGAIAERLALPVKTVKARHTRALAELRARLDKRSQGDRRAWMSALLPVTAQPGPRIRVEPRWAQLALGLAAMLAAVIAWNGLGRTRVGSSDARTSAITVPEPVRAIGATRSASLTPAREPGAAPREAWPTLPEAQEDAAQPAEEFTHVLEVDLARARELGWALKKDASDEQVLDAAMSIVRRRCESLGLAVRLLHIDADLGRFEVQSPATGERERELLEGWLRDLGLCEFLVVADEASVAGLDIDLAVEKQKLEYWRHVYPELPLAALLSLDPALGPHPRLTWAHTGFGDELGPEMPLLLPSKLDDHLGASMFARVFSIKDSFGYPCLSFDVLPSRLSDLSRFTSARVGQRLAAVIEDQVRSVRALEGEWFVTGSIEGRFRDEELLRLADSFRRLDGPLRIVETR